MTKMNQTRAITCAIGSRPGTCKTRHPFFGYQKEFEMLNQVEEHNSLQDTFRPWRIYAWTQDTGTLFDRLWWWRGSLAWLAWRAYCPFNDLMSDCRLVSRSILGTSIPPYSSDGFSA